MLLHQKLTHHFKEKKATYLLLAFLVFLGFFAGCFYANLISDTEFSGGYQQAELFIEGAKNNSLSFHLMLTQELSPYLLILFFSLGLLGCPAIIFLVFKWGFSLGFFLTFLVKCFSLKGFFLGGVFLLVSLIFLLIPLLVLTRKSLSVSLFLLSSALHKASLKKSLSEELIGLGILALTAILFVTLGVFVKYLLLPPFVEYLFL